MCSTTELSMLCPVWPGGKTQRPGGRIKVRGGAWQAFRCMEMDFKIRLRGEGWRGLLSGPARGGPDSQGNCRESARIDGYRRFDQQLRAVEAGGVAVPRELSVSPGEDAIVLRESGLTALPLLRLQRGRGRDFL